MGITPEMSQALAQQAIQTVGNQAMIVPQQASPDAAAQMEPAKKAEEPPAEARTGGQPISLLDADVSKGDGTDKDPLDADAPMDDELTDGPDSDEDVHNANRDGPPVEKTRKMPRKEKEKRIIAAATSGGAVAKLKTKGAKK